MSSFQSFHEEKKWSKLNPDNSLLKSQGLYFIQDLDLISRRGSLSPEKFEDLCGILSFCSKDPTYFFVVLYVNGIPYLYREQFYTSPGNDVAIKMNKERSIVSTIAPSQVHMSLVFLPSREVQFCPVI